jgi:hypothetical protein
MIFIVQILPQVKSGRNGVFTSPTLAFNFAFESFLLRKSFLKMLMVVTVCF